jgi:hypothetical protein
MSLPGFELMQKVFHSAPEIQRRIKVLGRGGQWLCSAELDYMLLSASTNSVYRADILKVFSSAFSLRCNKHYI